MTISRNHSGLEMPIAGIIILYFPNELVIDRIKHLCMSNISRLYCIDNTPIQKKHSYQYKLLETPDLIYIQNDSNIGIAAALNIGLKRARIDGYKLVLLLDQDSEPSSTMAKLLIKILLIDNGIGLVCPKIIDKDSDQTFQYYKGELENIKTAFSSGSLLKIDCIDKIGLFNENLFIDYVDVEFCLRLRLAGYKILRCNQAILYHSLGNTTWHSFLGIRVFVTNHPPLRLYYKTRNRTWMFKNYFFKAPFFVIKDFIRIFWEILKIFLYEKARKKKILFIIYGFRDGISNKLGKANSSLEQ